MVWRMLKFPIRILLLFFHGKRAPSSPRVYQVHKRENIFRGQWWVRREVAEILAAGYLAFFNFSFAWHFTNGKCSGSWIVCAHSCLKAHKTLPCDVRTPNKHSTILSEIKTPVFFCDWQLKDRLHPRENRRNVSFRMFFPFFSSRRNVERIAAKTGWS